MQFQLEPVDRLIPELLPLIEKHWLEVELNQNKIKLNPDWNTYKALESNNQLKFYTARCKGKLVGYYSVTIGVSAHHKEHVFATSDVIYLEPEYRTGFNALKLMKYVESNLKDLGVSFVIVSTKAHKSFSILLERMGYGINEISYSKYIGE